MRPEQLDHAIRAVTDILGEAAVIIIGSQSVLGSFTFEQPASPPGSIAPDAAQAARIS